jgi:hypothetical protein
MSSPSYRATKSGLAAEAHNKVLSKYDCDLASESLEWVKAVTGDNISTSGDMDNFWETLKDGQVLCRLANTLKPGVIKKVQNSTMAFKCMENINHFLTAAGQMGVPTVELFQTVDLWEKMNLNAVVICLHSLGRKGAQYGKPSIGPKESDKNVRNFTETQLKAGEGMIGLQMGSNKGANQSGMNIGNTRHM